MTNKMAVQGQVIDGEIAEPKAMTESQKLIKGLRDLASFLEAHPELPMTSSTLRVDYFPRLEEMAQYVKILGKMKKDGLGDSWFVLRKDFYRSEYASVSIEANWARERVCQKIKTGTKKIMQQIQTKPAETTQIEVEVETFEWKCPKVAAPPPELVEESEQP